MIDACRFRKSRAGIQHFGMPSNGRFRYTGPRLASSMALQLIPRGLDLGPACVPITTWHPVWRPRPDPERRPSHPDHTAAMRPSSTAPHRPSRSIRTRASACARLHPAVVQPVRSAAYPTPIPGFFRNRALMRSVSAIAFLLCTRPPYLGVRTRSIEKDWPMAFDPASLKYNDKGLIPAIAQDHATRARS